MQYSYKKLWFIAVIFLVLILCRMALPFIVRDYINQRLNQAPGYSGQVEDVSLSLFAGQIKLYHVELEKTTPSGIKPIITISNIVITLNWSSLWQGKPSTTIFLNSPNLHFVAEKPR